MCIRDRICQSVRLHAATRTARPWISTRPSPRHSTLPSKPTTRTVKKTADTTVFPHLDIDTPNFLQRSEISKNATLCHLPSCPLLRQNGEKSPRCLFSTHIRSNIFRPLRALLFTPWVYVFIPRDTYVRNTLDEMVVWGWGAACLLACLLL